MFQLTLDSVRALRGPNVWAPVPVLDVRLSVAGCETASPTAGPDFRSGFLPCLAGIPAPTGIFDRWRSAGGPPREAPALAEAVTQLTLAFQTLAGSPVGFGRTQPGADPHRFRLLIEYEEEDLARPCLAAAVALCAAALDNRPCDLAAELERLRHIADDVCLGPSTRAIVMAARQRDVPVRRLNQGSLIQLGQGLHQHRICAGETDRTGAIAETIACDKELTKQLLRAVGLPVPEGRLVTDGADAWQAAQDMAVPVVVKPLNGNHGRGVFIGLTKREAIVAAYEVARDEGDGVIVERTIPGAEHRLLVVGRRLAAATRGDPVYVVGDGQQTVAALVAELNRDPRRGFDAGTPLNPIDFDSPNRAALAHQGYTENSVLPAGVRVLVQRNGNLAADVTDQVHPDNAAAAVLAAQTVGLDVAGVDLVAEDIARPLAEQAGAFVEVNAGPGLQMHLQPAVGQPRPVGDLIVASLFPDGFTGRIPIIAVHGGPAATPLARLTSHLLHAGGWHTGLASAAGTFVNGRRAGLGAGTAAQAVANLLLHPWLAAAVIQTSARGILEEGLGFDRCQVAVLAADPPSSAPPSGESTDTAAVRRTLLETVADAGAVVVSADDLSDLAAAPAGRREWLLWADAEAHPAVVAHRERGGKAVFPRGMLVILADGGREEALQADGGVLRGHGATLLAAVAAAWALPLPADALQQGLDTFSWDR